MKIFVVCLLCFCVCACGGYKKEGDHVTFETCNEGNGCTSNVIPGADVASFENLSGKYGKDNRHVYFAGTPIDGALPSSFDPLSETYAKDGEHAYYKGTQIPSADVSSFVADRNLNYARDSRDIYMQGSPMNVCDVKSFRWLSDQWEVDDRCAYRGSQTLPGAHAKSFSVLNFWYAKDDMQVYTSVTPVIRGADAATFQLTDSPCEVCARDKNRCYKFGEVTSCDAFKH